MALDAVWTVGTFNITYRTVQVFVWVSESATLYILTQSWLKSFAAPGRRVARGRTQSAPEWWMCVLGPVFRTEDLYVYVSSITIRCLMGKTIKITNCTYFSLSVKDVNTRNKTGFLPLYRLRKQSPFATTDTPLSSTLNVCWSRDYAGHITFLSVIPPSPLYCEITVSRHTGCLSACSETQLLPDLRVLSDNQVLGCSSQNWP